MSLTRLRNFIAMLSSPNEHETVNTARHVHKMFASGEYVVVEACGEDGTAHFPRFAASGGVKCQLAAGHGGTVHQSGDKAWRMTGPVSRTEPGQAVVEAGPGEPGWEETKWGRWHRHQMDKMRRQAVAEAKMQLREEVRGEMLEAARLAAEAKGQKPVQKGNDWVYLREARYGGVCDRCKEDVEQGKPCYWRRGPKKSEMVCAPCGAYLGL